MFVDGDPRLRGCEPVHRCAGPSTEHVSGFLADGLGTTVPPRRHAHHQGTSHTPGVKQV